MAGLFKQSLKRQIGSFNIVKHIIETDGKTIWVNAEDGMCIGRFSRLGVDVHKTFEAQLDGGSQCLDCIHDLPHPEAWDRFRISMRHHHAVEVPESLRPAFARPEPIA